MQFPYDTCYFKYSICFADSKTPSEDEAKDSPEEKESSPSTSHTEGTQENNEDEHAEIEKIIKEFQEADFSQESEKPPEKEWMKSSLYKKSLERANQLEKQEEQVDATWWQILCAYKPHFPIDWL